MANPAALLRHWFFAVNERQKEGWRRVEICVRKATVAHKETQQREAEQKKKCCHINFNHLMSPFLLEISTEED